MTLGMLWHLSDPKKSLSEQAKTALEHYENKFAKVPKIIIVHPQQKGGFEPIDGISIVGGKVQLNHILVFPAEEE